MAGIDPGLEPEFREFLQALADAARSSGAFARVTAHPTMVVCEPKVAGEEASYRVEIDGGRVFVGWATPNRWMSQSVEAELKWTGDDLQELIEDECRVAGYEGPPIGMFEHFRSPELLYTFRNHVPMSGAAGRPGGAVDVRRVAQCLLGYEGTFRELGDMRRAAADEA